MIKKYTVGYGRKSQVTCFMEEAKPPISNGIPKFILNMELFTEYRRF